MQTKGIAEESSEVVDIGWLAASERTSSTVTRTCFVLLLTSGTVLLACPLFCDPETHAEKLKTSLCVAFGGYCVTVQGRPFMVLSCLRFLVGQCLIANRNVHPCNQGTNDKSAPIGET